MTPAGTTTALTGGVALLERAMGYTLGSLLLVTPEAMANPTPCSDWDLRALLLHMNDSLLTLHVAITEGHVGLDPEADHGTEHGRDQGDARADYGDPTVEPVPTLRNRACRMIGAWANARGPTEITFADRPLGADIVAATGAVEVAVHGWDVARACGQVRPIPDALADELLELCALFVSDADRPTRFGAPVEVPPTATAGDRLLALLGRRPR